MAGDGSSAEQPLVGALVSALRVIQPKRNRISAGINSRIVDAVIRYQLAGSYAEPIAGDEDPET